MATEVLSFGSVRRVPLISSLAFGAVACAAFRSGGTVRDASADGSGPETVVTDAAATADAAEASDDRDAAPKDAAPCKPQPIAAVSSGPAAAVNSGGTIPAWTKVTEALVNDGEGAEITLN